MGPRIQSPSLVDEYVCETMNGEDCVRASGKYIMKVAEQYKDDLEIPFTFRNNVVGVAEGPEWSTNGGPGERNC